MTDVHETNKETNLSSDVSLLHDDKLIVSNLFSNKYASNGIKIDGLSELTAHPTFDKCDLSNDRLTKSMFIADTKIASSTSQKHNLGQNLNPEPSVTKEPIKAETISRPILQPFKHSVTQAPSTSKESCYHQSGQSRDVLNRPSFDYSRANASTCETRFAQPPMGSNLKPVDYNQTTMIPTQFSNSYSGNDVNWPEPSNKELPTSSRNFSIPNAYQSPVILSPSVAPTIEQTFSTAFQLIIAILSSL